MPQTVGLKRQMLMSHSPGGCKFAIKVPAGLAAGERSLPGLQTATFALRPHVVEAEGTLMPLPRALRGPNPPPGTPPSRLRLELIISRRPNSSRPHTGAWGFDI